MHGTYDGTTPRYDLNYDGVVDIYDLLIIGFHISEITILPYNYDVNADGIVDIFDLTQVSNSII